MIITPLRTLLTFILITLPLLAGGCSLSSPSSQTVSAEMFEAAGMRIHPVFTQVKDWNGDGKADGIEALVEITDRFGDPAKASGQVLFELFDYRPRDPDPRGARLANPWIGSLQTVRDQQTHWNNTTQTYNFKLAYPQISTSHSYVLTATFETTSGNRFFNRIILTPTTTGAPSVAKPTTQPAN